MAAAVEITPAIIPTARRVPDRFRTLSGTIAAVAPLILVVIVAILFQQAAPAGGTLCLGLPGRTAWDSVTGTLRSLPAFFGTVAIAFLVLAFALLARVAGAVCLPDQ